MKKVKDEYHHEGWYNRDHESAECDDDQNGHENNA